MTNTAHITRTARRAAANRAATKAAAALTAGDAVRHSTGMTGVVIKRTSRAQVQVTTETGQVSTWYANGLTLI